MSAYAFVDIGGKVMHVNATGVAIHGVRADNMVVRDLPDTGCCAISVQHGGDLFVSGGTVEERVAELRRMADFLSESADFITIKNRQD